MLNNRTKYAILYIITRKRRKTNKFVLSNTTHTHTHTLELGRKHAFYVIALCVYSGHKFITKFRVE